MIRRLDEPARTSKAAVDRHLRVMYQTLNCVTTTGHIYTSAAGGSLSLVHSDRDGDVTKLRRAAGDLYLDVVQRFRPYQQDDRSWRVTVTEYAYSIYERHPNDQGVRPMFAWHWHPTTHEQPHLHVVGVSATVDALHKLHVPTRRITFEAVIEFAIFELQVEPVRDDWQERLTDSTRRVEKHLRWLDRPPSSGA